MVKIVIGYSTSKVLWPWPIGHNGHVRGAAAGLNLCVTSHVRKGQRVTDGRSSCTEGLRGWICALWVERHNELLTSDRDGEWPQMA